MLKTTIIGASGYTGAELALMVNKHPQLTLSGLYVSANSVFPQTVLMRERASRSYTVS